MSDRSRVSEVCGGILVLVVAVVEVSVVVVFVTSVEVEGIVADRVAMLNRIININIKWWEYD